MAADRCASKKDIRATRFARLLDKAVVKQALAQSAGRDLRADTFETVWPDHYECYFLTLGTWGSKKGWRWNQTSRRGYNLVLQLNFSSAHDDPYRRLVDPEDKRPFEDWDHPVAKKGFHTLAWARLDVDLDNDEALIEEIQNDWLRNAMRYRRFVSCERGPYHLWGSKKNNDRFVQYVDEVLHHHQAIWQEAILSAAIWFLRIELGVRRIYFHTHESGARLKSIRYTLPPRSLYTRLPRQFCFRETDETPGFLDVKTKTRARREIIRNATFFEMQL